MAENNAKGRRELRASMWQCMAHLKAVAIFSVFVNLLMLTGPLFMLQTYDRVLSSRSEATLFVLLLLVTGLFLMMGLLEYVRGRVLARAGARFQRLLDARVFEAVLRRSMAPSDRARPNTAARDLDSVRQLLSGPAPFALFDIPWTPIFLGAIFLFHPLLGVIAIFAGGLLIGLTLINQMRSRMPNAESQITGAQAENMGEALRQNAEAVQALGMRGMGMNRWESLRTRALSKQIEASDTTASYSSASKALRFYLQSFMLAAGAWLVLQQEISPGMMIAGSILLGRALSPIEQAIGQWGLFQRAVRGWSSLSDLLEKTPVEPPKTELPAPKGHLDVANVTVIAPGETVPALRNISFRVEPGQALGVIGPSGSGKTTLAKVLTNIWKPAAGKVRVDGAALDQWPADVLGRHIGYLPQEIGLLTGPVADNIARLDPQPDPKEIVLAAQRAGAHELLLSLPKGYDTDIGAGGQRLSGGQRQRVALARALYGDPPLMILDEPNANLDAPGEQALVDAIREAKSRGRAVVIMAHRPSAIAACDYLLMIDKGTQIEYGPRDEVLKKRTRNYPQLAARQASGGAAAAGGQGAVAVGQNTLAGTGNTAMLGAARTATAASQNVVLAADANATVAVARSAPAGAATDARVAPAAGTRPVATVTSAKPVAAVARAAAKPAPKVTGTPAKSDAAAVAAGRNQPAAPDADRRATTPPGKGTAAPRAGTGPDTAAASAPAPGANADAKTGTGATTDAAGGGEATRKPAGKAASGDTAAGPAKPGRKATAAPVVRPKDLS